MVKSVLKNSLIYALALYMLPLVIAGVTINGGIITYLIAGFILGILFTILQPVFKVLTFPLNMITFGLFSIVTNSIILYILTVFVPNIIIKSFKFSGFSFAGFIIPEVMFNTILTFFAASCLLMIITGFIKWLTN